MQELIWPRDGFLVVIGASAGGTKAISQLLKSLAPDINAAVCIALHLSPTVDAQHFQVKLQKSTTLPCHTAGDNMTLEKGHVYLAPSNYHMIIKEAVIVLGPGPAESKWRPSIDVTFRSAAVAWDTHCIGIILTGLLNDGVAGMEAIHRCGGITMVQDILDAEYPDMPQAVLNEIPATRSIAIDDMVQSIERILADPLPRRRPPREMLQEARLAQQVATRIDHMLIPGHRHTYYTCPDCGGGLWEIREDQLVRYSCHIGHTFTENELAISQGEKMEETLWIALRIMEERRYLLNKVAGREDTQGAAHLARSYHQRAEEMDLHIERLKEFIFSYQRTEKR